MRKRYKNSRMSWSAPDNAGTKRKNSFLKISTTIYSAVPETDGDMYVITQAGDRLDNLAYQYYEDPALWWFIAHVNNLTTMNVEAGLTLRIPSSLVGANAF